jgi:hypothetical protein
MAFAFVALWTLHLSSLKVDAKTNHETVATFLGNQKLEEMRSAAGTDFSKLAINASTFAATSTVGGLYSQTLSISDVTPWRKDVAVTLTWPDKVRLGDGSRSSVARSVTLSTILTNLELN